MKQTSSYDVFFAPPAGPGRRPQGLFSARLFETVVTLRPASRPAPNEKRAFDRKRLSYWKSRLSRKAAFLFNSYDTAGPGRRP